MCSLPTTDRRYGCLLRWRAWIRPVVIVLYSVVLLVVLPLLVVKLQASDAGPQDQASFIGGLFVLLALPISFWEITQHLVHYTKPELQKHIIRILWMVPIYAINAWFGLLLPAFAFYMDTCRECYEAYVIYNFLMFLLNFLKEAVDIEVFYNDRPPAKHLCPFCCLPACHMGSSFIEKCKHGILQYTVVRPITTAIAFVCEMTGVYGEGLFRPNFAYPYLTVVNQMSQFVAMYCLVFFYQVHKTELAPMKPLSKFLCIKSVVFFSFFQGFVIAILVYTGAISATFTTEDNKVQRISSSLQNFLICVEMLLAAIAHMFAFSHKPYVNCEDGQSPSCWHSFKAMWDVSDVQQDVSNHIRTVVNFRSRTYETMEQPKPEVENIDSRSLLHALHRFFTRKRFEDRPTLSVVNSASPKDGSTDHAKAQLGNIDDNRHSPNPASSSNSASMISDDVTAIPRQVNQTGPPTTVASNARVDRDAPVSLVNPNFKLDSV